APYFNERSPPPVAVGEARSSRRWRPWITPRGARFRRSDRPRVERRRVRPTGAIVGARQRPVLEPAELPAAVRRILDVVDGVDAAFPPRPHAFAVQPRHARERRLGLDRLAGLDRKRELRVRRKPIRRDVDTFLLLRGIDLETPPGLHAFADLGGGDALAVQPADVPTAAEVLAVEDDLGVFGERRDDVVVTPFVDRVLVRRVQLPQRMLFLEQ